MGGAIYLFTLRGIPVYVSLWYFLLIGYFAMGGDLRTGLLWGVCVTFSILVHEFGHGLAAKRFGLSPSIMLHGWGGLTAHERAERDRDDAIIIAAGPAAGLFLGGLVWVAREITAEMAPQYVYGAGAMPVVFSFLLYINLFWSLINLVPFWPLDGGQLFRLLMLRIYKSPAQAERVTHMVGIGMGAVAIAAAMLYFKSPFLGILAAMLAFQNVSQLSASSASGPIRGKDTTARALLDMAEEALLEGNFEEAARIAHQIRSDTHASSATLGKVWEILAVATVHLGEYEEAESYIKRAPQTDNVIAARAMSAFYRGDREASKELLEPPLVDRLSDDHRQALEGLLADS